jgi:S1-C subfamily serine protease
LVGWGVAIGAVLGLLIGAITPIASPPPLGAATVVEAGRFEPERPPEWDTIEARLLAATVALRSRGCGPETRGTGVRVPGGLVITAGHVVTPATEVFVDGRPAGRPLVAPAIDVATVSSDGGRALPEAEVDPTPGEEVRVAGRSTGSTRVRVARVQGYRSGRDPGDPPTVMRLDVRADPGDSGGPVVDATGRLVGIVYATERVTQLALVIPVSVLRLVLAGALAPRGC